MVLMMRCSIACRMLQCNIGEGKIFHDKHIVLIIIEIFMDVGEMNGVLQRAMPIAMGVKLAYLAWLHQESKESGYVQ